MKAIKLVYLFFIISILTASCSKEENYEIPGNTPPESYYFLDLVFVDSEGNDLVKGIKHSDTEEKSVYPEESIYPINEEIFKSKNFTEGLETIIIGTDPDKTPQNIGIRLIKAPLFNINSKPEQHVFQLTSKHIFNNDKPHFIVTNWDFDNGYYLSCKNLEFEGKTYWVKYDTKSGLNSVKIVVER